MSARGRLGWFLGWGLAASACAFDRAHEEPELGVSAVAEALHGATSDLSFEVQVRDTGSAQLHATIYAKHALVGATWLAVPGLGENAATFENLASALLQVEPSVGRIVALDPIGHGGSSFPEGLSDGAMFGDLTIEDSVSVLLQTIDQLRARGLGPNGIIGHSLGGLEIQAAQETLLAQGSSLANKGVRRALLLAPVPPHARPWDAPPLPDLSSLVVQDPELGSYVTFPPEVWTSLAFSRRDGSLASDAPSSDEVQAQAYIGPEPLFTALQLLESPIPTSEGSDPITFPRPSVREGAFAWALGTRLSVVGFEQDSLVPPADLADLYRYLASDPSGARYVEVSGLDAVHASYITEPAPIIAALDWRNWF
jgi:pimeloyl-ACP methyl ester carboxylesterase